MATNDSRPTYVKKYFLETPKQPSYGPDIAMLIMGGLGVLGGLVAFIVSMTSNDGSAICCAIPLGLGGLFFAGTGGMNYMNKGSKYKREYELAEPKPSDSQMDEWLSQDKQKIISDAVEKLGLVPEKVLNLNDPLVVVGPRSSAIFKLGNDGNIRFSSYEIVVIYLTDYHLGAYSCQLDFINGKINSEETQEYHYADVVSVSTLSSNTNFIVTTVDGKEHPIQSHQQFSLSVASGESIKVTVAFPQVEGIFKQGKLLPSGSEKAINTLRTMLREKKGGIQH
jgi:hypothetical protein